MSYKLTFPLDWSGERCAVCGCKCGHEDDCPAQEAVHIYGDEERELFCCGCQQKVQARLTIGGEIYPHRRDLHELPFWRCDTCGNYVGCHHKTNNPTNPLGNIPTPELRNARQHIHRILDPMWKTGRIKRSRLYGMISERLGWQYHTAAIRNVEEARKVYSIVKEIYESNL